MNHESGEDSANSNSEGDESDDDAACTASSTANSVDASVRIRDGTLASYFINRRVRKYWNTRYYKGWFHGTVKSFEVKPKNKYPVVFSVLFDEDQKYVYFCSKDLLKYLE